MIYPLSDPKSLSPEAVDAAMTVLKSGRYTMGEQVERFEYEFARWVGARHAIMVNSGSSANLLAVDALIQTGQWHVGDEVLVPAVAWSTTVSPLLQLGLIPVFVDVDPTTLAIDWQQAALMLSRKTRGVMLIHVLGLAADLDEAQAFCRAHSLTLLEDCCESFGAHHRARSVGTVGTLGTFSHYFAHQLTTIEGGTIVTDDERLADTLRSLRSHGWIRNRRDRRDWEVRYRTELDPRFLFVTTGYNVRPMELQGAIGRVQLHQIDALLKGKDDAALAMLHVLWRHFRIPGDFARAPVITRTTRRHSWMNLPIMAGPRRDQVVKLFESHGIETRPILAGNLLRHPAMQGPLFRRALVYPVADQIMREGFMIGVYPSEAGLQALTCACQALEAAA